MPRRRHLVPWPPERARARSWPGGLCSQGAGPRAASHGAVPPQGCAAADRHRQASSLVPAHRRGPPRWPAGEGQGNPDDPPGCESACRGAVGKGVATPALSRTGSHASTTKRACADKRRASRRPGSLTRCRHRGRSTAGSGEWLAKIKKVVEDANAELKRRDRDTLVHAVEHACEVEFWRQPERREAEAPDAEPRE
jgi:hypothetical protein